MGPFTQEDPIGIAGGLNLYGYANGDPINFSDPFGLCPEPPDAICALGNFAAGFGDAVTFGLTAKVRDAIGAGDQVDESSATFVAGAVTAVATEVAIAGAAKASIEAGEALLKSKPVQAAGRRLFNSTVGRAFRSGGRFNGGGANARFQRMGFGRSGDNVVFRIAGERIKQIFGVDKIDIADFGRIADFLGGR